MPSASLNNYVGSTISIVTNRGIRYEGHLLGYDVGDKSITLQKVWVMGSENRQAANWVGPSISPEPYLKFHATSVRDFKILDSSPVRDPAIMSRMPPSKMGRRASPKRLAGMRNSNLSVMSLLNGDVTPRHRVVDMNLLMSRAASQQANQSARDGQRQSRGNGPPQKQSNRNNNHRDSNRAANRSHQQNPRGASGGNSKRAKQNQANQQNKNSRHVSFKTDSPSAGRPNRGRRQFIHVPLIPQNHNKRQGGRMATSPASSSQSRSTPGTFPKSKTPRKVYKDDFDFDQAHAKFKELTLGSSGCTKNKNDDKAEGESENAAAAAVSKDADNAAPELKESAYDQDKSFFDNLSMTADIEGQQRLTRRQVMQANKETFGMAYVPGRRNFFRGRSGNFRRQNERSNFGPQFHRMGMAH